MKKGILFDLDGTLWDSSANVIASWNDCIAKNSQIGRTYTQEQMQSYMGKTLEQIADIMFPMLAPDERYSLLRKCNTNELDYLREHKDQKYYPLERETLEKLYEGYLLAVVSNCQDGYIQVFLEQCGFGGLFADFECAGRTGKSKGENIRLVMERNGLESCVYVGDTNLDGEAARAAGVPFIHAGYGFGFPDEFDARIMGFDELPATVAKLI